MELTDIGIFRFKNLKNPFLKRPFPFFSVFSPNSVFSVFSLFFRSTIPYLEGMVWVWSEYIYIQCFQVWWFLVYTWKSASHTPWYIHIIGWDGEWAPKKFQLSDSKQGLGIPMFTQAYSIYQLGGMQNEHWKTTQILPCRGELGGLFIYRLGCLYRLRETVYDSN